MDILRKELEAIYAGQRLGDETLPQESVEEVCAMAGTLAAADGGCAVREVR